MTGIGFIKGSNILKLLNGRYSNAKALRFIFLEWILGRPLSRGLVNDLDPSHWRPPAPVLS